MTEGLELKVPQRKASEARNAFSTEQVGQLLVAAKAYSEDLWQALPLLRYGAGGYHWCATQ